MADASPVFRSASPPPERTWRDLLADAFDNFAVARSRSPSPKPRNRGGRMPLRAVAINAPSNAMPETVTSPTGSGWLLQGAASTAGEEDETGTEADTEVELDDVNVPSVEQEEGEALRNEINARRAQMAAIAEAARGFTHHQLVPPRVPVAAASPCSLNPDSPSAISSTESEEFFARPCQGCMCSSATPCEWSSLPGQWRAKAKAAAWTEAGIPSPHRAQLWLACMGLDTPEARTSWNSYYAALLQHAVSITTEHSSSPTAAADGTFHQPHPRAQFSSIAFKEVLKDVERTLPTMVMFATPNGPGQRALQRLLLAFSLHRPLVGYCQGLGFVAATVLLVFSGHSEALAFGMFCSLLEQRLACYVKSMLGSVQDARVLRDLLGFYDPDLAALFTKHAVSVEHFSASWLLCLFVGSPLPLHHAVRVWDLLCLHGEHVLHLVGLGLFAVHRASFFSTARPTPDHLMGVLTKLVGATTDVHLLLADVRERLEAPHLADFPRTLRTMRRFHRHELVREFATLQPSRLRRLERSSGLPAAELARLWGCFLEGSEDAWATLVSGAINDLLHFRLALAAAVFPQPKHAHAAPTAVAGGAAAAASAHDFDLAGATSEALRWKGCGVVDATSPHRAAPGRCVVCVPPLPASVHLDPSCTVMTSCPRCSWALARQPVATVPAGWLAPPTPCTCACACLSRGVTLSESASSSSSSVVGAGGSVFHRLFHFFGGHERGFLDFEHFVAACALFLHSDRVTRLQAVFRLAGGCDLDEERDSATSSGIQRGHVRRVELESFVSAFEELYHGHSFLYLPQPPSFPSTFTSSAARRRSSSSSSTSSASALPPPLRLASSVASARMFVDMLHDKERAARPSPSPSSMRSLHLDDENESTVDGASQPEEFSTQVPPSLLAPSSPSDSLSYESFASFIVLHPLISAFFRLDSIVD